MGPTDDAARASLHHAAPVLTQGAASLCVTLAHRGLLRRGGWGERKVYKSHDRYNRRGVKR